MWRSMCEQLAFGTQAASYAVRDRLIESWNDTNQWYRQTDPKRVYYLSMEFLMVRHRVGNKPSFPTRQKG